MTPEQMQILKTEITADPLDMGYANKSDDDRATILNSLSVPVIRPVTVAQAMMWAASGPRVRIAAAAATHSNEQIKASCQVVLDLMTGGTYQLIHLNDQELQSVLTGWVQAGVISQGEKDALITRATVLIGRGESLCGEKIIGNHISIARL